MTLDVLFRRLTKPQIINEIFVLVQNERNLFKGLSGIIWKISFKIMSSNIYKSIYYLNLRQNKT